MNETTPSLDSSEVERYARHIILRDIGGPGQLKLKQARVLVVGAGGIGSPVLQYLAAAGIGTIGIVDDDKVTLSNLQRQIIHGTSDIEQLKVDSAEAGITQLNPHVNVVSYPLRLTQNNARDIISQYDIIVDGSDNFETRYLVADTCLVEKKPLITAALGQFDGSITTIKGYEKSAQGQLNPTFRCIFPERSDSLTVLPTCSTAGIIASLPGIIGSMAATEVIRELTGFGSDLIGRLILIDTYHMRFETIKYKRNT
ncbi:molybdopterin-synthase adenylyltransferase MoeB [Microvirga sp. W0021]|uniref:Molybdopterin-synthase adenylyltransferase MoeB n=1 Tax=Hohaiivirga grylli TaxID=3133970 RepID=A0ABV0BGK1_9HYPH